VFDTPEELLARIRLGEDSALELKAVRFRGGEVAGPARNDLADELAAMANTRPAVLVLGVDDKNRTIEGIPIERLDAVEDLVREVCLDSITPVLPVTTLRMELPASTGEVRAVLKIDVPRSPFVHRSPGGYFHRVASSRRQIPPDLLARLFQERSQALAIRFDEQAVPGTTPADLDVERVLSPGRSRRHRARQAAARPRDRRGLALYDRRHPALRARAAAAPSECADRGCPVPRVAT
jgi:ATP-dependent DNA helicase RecG